MTRRRARENDSETSTGATSAGSSDTRTAAFAARPTDERGISAASTAADESASHFVHHASNLTSGCTHVLPDVRLGRRLVQVLPLSGSGFFPVRASVRTFFSGLLSHVARGRVASRATPLRLRSHPWWLVVLLAARGGRYERRRGRAARNRFVAAAMPPRDWLPHDVVQLVVRQRTSAPREGSHRRAGANGGPDGIGRDGRAVGRARSRPRRRTLRRS
jgi:hypothetical protein